jgi:hypothetical protein
MKKLILFSLLTSIALIFSCSKDEDISEDIIKNFTKPSVSKESLLDIYHLPNLSSTDLSTQLRTGRDLPTFDIKNLAILNSKFNEQYLFNKDSVLLIKQTRLDPEIVKYNDTTVMGVFNVNVLFKNGSIFSFNGYTTDQVDSRKRKNYYEIKPYGFNYGKGINNFIVYFRTPQVMKYYDSNFTVFKRKSLYIVYDNKYNILYQDYIPSRLEKSDVFLLRYSYMN